jgi:radical SAM superfamily enzyme YgiQ (UPF0313 family)
LGYLASVLEGGGHTVQIKDLALGEGKVLDAARQAVREFAPDLVGISSTTASFPLALRLAEMSKAEQPTAPVVMGGCHVTFTAEDTLRGCPAVDVVVRGEGEETLRELAERLQMGRGLEDVLGVSYRQDGRPTHNPPRPFIQDLDALPWPARHLFDKSYAPMGALITSRGCPGRCIFCASTVMSGHRYRARRPERVVDEMECLHYEWGSQRLLILDDTFTALVKKLTLPVCAEIKRRRLQVAWGCESRVDVATPEVLDVLREAGCDRIQFGVESGSPRVLATLRKGITLEQVRQAIRYAVGLGMDVICTFILGHPDETEEDAQLSIDFVQELWHMGVGVASFAFLTPFPGTDVYEHREAYGITLHETDWAKFTFGRPIISTKYLSQERLRELYMDANIRAMREAQAMPQTEEAEL